MPLLKQLSTNSNNYVRGEKKNYIFIFILFISK